MPDTDKITLLIVDEDVDLLKSLSLFFANNFNVIAVSDYEQMTRHLGTARLALFEAGIFEKTGFNAIKTIKNEYPRLTIIIMCTAWTSHGISDEFVQNHADAIIYKPFDINRVSRIITQLTKKGNISEISTQC
ncbi:response regulator [candidate division KSB1 bacterium]